MAGGLFPIFLRRLRQSLTATPGGETADAELLERFLARRDEAAFEALVGRHGPMVLGVCGRVLGDVHAAEDAFQATFLVLVRRAGAIRRRASLGSWLHGVAYRAALKARAREACRRRHEREAMPPEPTDPTQDVVWRDLRPVLDAALDRLPEKYRAPLVLCFLEGKTQEEAARLLGWPVGTLATRVRRGRARLRALLVRRGVALSAAGLTVALAQGSASAAVPAALVRSTVAHALHLAAGSAAAGTVPASIEVLVTGVLRTMKTTKIRRALLVGLVIVLIGGGALLWHERSARATVAEPTAEREPALVNPLEGAKAGTNKDHELLQGTWNIDAMEFGGKSIPKELMKGYKYVFAGNKLTWDAAIAINVKGGKVTAADGVYPCDFKIDPSKEPKQIDITFHFDKTGDHTILGIYEIKGDTLKVCFLTSKTGKRPEDFSAKDTPSSGYVVLTRAKVADPAPKKEPGADKAIVSKELELLQGTWNVDTQGWSGKDLPKELMKGYKFVFSGTKLTWDAAIAMNSKSGKITAIDGAYPCDIKINPGKEPKEIDITFHFDKTGDRTVLGIYEIKGDTLKLCYYSNKTGKRPIDFDPDINPSIGRVTLTRAKK